MNSSDNINEIVEIDFEVGHSSTIRSEATTNHNPPRTHDWKIYLRSVDVNGDLSCLIQRCIFYLHPDYPNNRRELKTTPFAIQETGYAGFHLPIEIYFKSKKDPKKFRIDYNLDLHQNVDGHPYRHKESYVRRYRCTFYNPDSGLRQKILAAGGKIVDKSSIPLNNTDVSESGIDEKHMVNNETIICHSPQQKRSVSPVVKTDGVQHKKVKLEQTANEIKTKHELSANKSEHVNTNSMNTKRSKLLSHKSFSPMIDEKIIKFKTSYQTDTNKAQYTCTENESITKSRSSIKLKKSQSTNDIKFIKKDASISASLNSKQITNTQHGLKRPINKNLQNSSVTTQQSLPSSDKSPSSNFAKPQSPLQPSLIIKSIKKIPKKCASISNIASINQSQLRDSQEHPSLASKAKPNIKKVSSSSSIKSLNGNNRSKTIYAIKNHVARPTSDLSQQNQSDCISPLSYKSLVNQDIPTPSKFISSPCQSNVDPSVNSNIILFSSSSPIDGAQSFGDSPSPIEFAQNVNTHLQVSDKSNSSSDNSLIQPRSSTAMPTNHSVQSNIHDSDLSLDDDHDEEDDAEDLPTSLTNDDLHYKLIYIYKRFQLHSVNDLCIFVRFFKRHHMIDPSLLSMTKSANDMFTYDLLSLSPSHIGELANDLGYATVNMINAIEKHS